MKKTHNNCNTCRLYTTKTQFVAGAGSLTPKILLLKEAPEKEENEQGISFIGTNNKLLYKLLNTIGIKQSDIYITNTVKCFPPKKHNPTLTELQICNKFLIKEIEILQPETIVCLGRIPTQALYLLAGQTLPKGSLRGKRFFYNKILVLSTWHPAYIKHNLNKESELLEDLVFAYTAQTIIKELIK